MGFKISIYTGIMDVKKEPFIIPEAKIVDTGEETFDVKVYGPAQEIQVPDIGFLGYLDKARIRFFPEDSTCRRVILTFEHSVPKEKSQYTSITPAGEVIDTTAGYRANIRNESIDPNYVKIELIGPDSEGLMSLYPGLRDIIQSIVQGRSTIPWESGAGFCIDNDHSLEDGTYNAVVTRARKVSGLKIHNIARSIEDELGGSAKVTLLYNELPKPVVLGSKIPEGEVSWAWVFKDWRDDAGGPKHQKYMIFNGDLVPTQPADERWWSKTALADYWDE